jgi:hypothetical protein
MAVGLYTKRSQKGVRRARQIARRRFVRDSSESGRVGVAPVPTLARTCCIVRQCDRCHREDSSATDRPRQLSAVESKPASDGRIKTWEIRAIEMDVVGRGGCSSRQMK